MEGTDSAVIVEGADPVSGRGGPAKKVEVQLEENKLKIQSKTYHEKLKWKLL